MERYTSFKDFYPYYLSEHDNKYTKLLHFIGTTIAIYLYIRFFITFNFINYLLCFINYFFFYNGFREKFHFILDGDSAFNHETEQFKKLEGHYVSSQIHPANF